MALTGLFRDRLRVEALTKKSNNDEASGTDLRSLHRCSRCLCVYALRCIFQVESLMSTSTTRWNLVVSSELDKSLRQFLAAEGRGKKGELSRFVEEAVSKHIFDTAHKAAREHNKDVTPEEIEAIVDESLAWARSRRR
jgi:ribbon-helix-helix protein